MANIINGKEISAAIREEIKAGVQGMSVRPGLAVVLVGDDPASAVYVRKFISNSNFPVIPPRSGYIPRYIAFRKKPGGNSFSDLSNS